MKAKETKASASACIGRQRGVRVGVRAAAARRQAPKVDSCAEAPAQKLPIPDTFDSQSLSQDCEGYLQSSNPAALQSFPPVNASEVIFVLPRRHPSRTRVNRKLGNSCCRISQQLLPDVKFVHNVHTEN